MKQHYTKSSGFFRSVSAMFFMLFFGMTAFAQPTTVIETDHVDNNGSGMVTFNVQNTNPYAIVITEFRCNSTTAGATTVLYNPTPTTNVGSWSAGTVDAGQNGWILVGNGTTAGGGVTVPVLQGPSLLTIPPNTTYQFCISMSSMGYMTLTAGAGINTYSGGGVNILTGDGISWGGVAVPATPSNYPRGLVGGISFVQGLPQLVDDAGVTEFVTPLLPTCSFSDSVRVAIKNFGSDTLTTAQVNWKWNTTLMPPVSWTGSLAPFESDTVTLGLVALASGDDLWSYTSIPNGAIEAPTGALNDTSSIIDLSPGLSGIKTIGGATPDYADIASAVTALSTYGVCGPVIFDIRDGVYTAQMDLPSLVSMSAVNTVTFRSQSADPALVTITTASTSAANNYVVKMSNANNFHFKNLTLENTGTSFSTIIAMTGSSMNSFTGCKLTSSIGTSTSTNNAIVYSNTAVDSNNVFMNNTFTGGSYGMYWYGPSTTLFEKNNEIVGNTFTNQYYRGIMVYYNDGVQIKNNTFIGNSTYTSKYAIYLYYAVGGATDVSGNNVRGEGANGWLYGVYWSQGGGNNAVRSKFTNNMIQVGWTGSTGTNYGMYLIGAGYVDVFHNSILASAGGASTRAFYATSGGGIEVKNNIFANYSGGYAYYVGNAFTVSNSDYNVLYSPAGNIGYFNSNTLTLDDWQLASSYDANSIDYNPNFFSDNDLHVCSDSIGNQGTPIASITMDIDGHSRSTTNPDMGADEFNGIVGSFLGNDVTICAGDSIQLIAGSPTDTILWSNGATTSAIWVSSPGSYSVTVNSACGTGSDAIVVTASALNYAGYMEASDVVFCSGDSVLLTSNQAATSYLWSNGSTNDSIWVTAGGTYTLTITDGCGTGTEGLTVTMNNVPTASFTAVGNFFTGAFTNTSVSGGTTTYLWDFGDGTTSTDMNPNHLYTTTGDHTVTLTVTNDCGSNTFTSTVNTWAVGLEEVDGIVSLIVYPNPSTGLFNVNFDLQKDLKLDVQVSNVMGQVISVMSIDAKNGVFNEKIDLSNEAAGVYYLNILSEGKTLGNKMLIKK